MWNVVFNKDNLTENDVTKRVKKARAFIVDTEDNVWMVKVNGVYMLPGGCVEQSDTNPCGAVVREVREELGIDLNKKKLYPMVKIDNYDKDSRVCGETELCNKKTSTIIYLSSNDDKPNEVKRQLTAQEKNMNMTIEKVPLKDFKSKMLMPGRLNFYKKYFMKENLAALKAYYKETNRKEL